MGSRDSSTQISSIFPPFGKINRQVTVLAFAPFLTPALNFSQRVATTTS